MTKDTSRIKAGVLKYLPFMAFFFLAAILLLSSTLSKHAPEIESVSPKTGSSGDELVITGK
jgi:hypothetical protein